MGKRRGVALLVDDAAPLGRRAIAAGAGEAMAVADPFSRDRYRQVRDPFGHLWSIGAPISSAGR